MAGRSARTMSTVCAASGILANPAWRLDETSNEGLSTRRNRCLSSGCCVGGCRSLRRPPRSQVLRGGLGGLGQLDEPCTVPGQYLQPW
eukprot:6994489-Pyramimonas_sp.AAC.1